jgi:hypothetical protein
VDKNARPVKNNPEIALVVQSKKGKARERRVKTLAQSWRARCAKPTDAHFVHKNVH